MSVPVPGTNMTFQRTLLLLDEHDTRRRATVLTDMLLDFSNNNFESLNDFLEWGKTYRLTIEEVNGDVAIGTGPREDQADYSAC